MRRGVDWILDVFLAGPRIWLVVMLAAAIAACVWNARLTVFMIDSGRVNCSFAPSDPFSTRHSCFSAYAEGARFAAAGDVNIYETGLYAPNTKAGVRRLIGGNLRVDPYHYPPPFLLAPAAIRLVAPEFAATRAVWFMMQSLLIAAALVMVSRWIGGVPGAWAAASGWLMLASPTVLLTLQAGNFQVTVYSLAMIALVLVSTGRELSGAAMLAYATVGKIVPGVLVLFLLTARRWRAAALHGRVRPDALRDHHRGVRVEADERFHLVRDAEDREWRGVPADGNAQHAADEPVGVWGDRAAARAAGGVVRPQLVWPWRRQGDRLDLRHRRRAPAAAAGWLAGSVDGWRKRQGRG